MKILCKYCSKEIDSRSKTQSCRKCFNIYEIKASLEKTKKTNLDRYGVEWSFQSNNNKKKTEQTMLKKYGVKYSAQNKDVLNKQQQTNLDRYGVTCNLALQSNKEASKKTKLCKYGSETYNNRDKAKETNLLKYGVPWTSLLKESKEKMSSTILARSEEESKLIAQKHSCAKNKFKSNDGISLDSSWELLVWEFCIRNNIPIKRGPVIEYFCNGVKHKTLIDFDIDGKLFEVKGGHLLNDCYGVPISEKLNVYKKNLVTIISNSNTIFKKEIAHFLTVISIYINAKSLL